MTRAAFSEVTVDGIEGVWTVVRPHWGRDRRLTGYAIRRSGTMDPTELVTPDRLTTHTEPEPDLTDTTWPPPGGLVEPTPEVLATLPPRGPTYRQLTIPGTPSRPRRHGSTVRAHCTRCGRYAANPHRETDTGYCVVHGACHLTWG